jgi:hypothetical protein
MWKREIPKYCPVCAKNTLHVEYKARGYFNYECLKCGQPSKDEAKEEP